MFESFQNLTLEELVVVFTTPLYTILILTEIALSQLHERHFYTVKDTITNLVLMICNGGIDLLTRGITWGFLAWFYQFHFVSIQTPWVYWLVLLLAEDFVFYFLHVVDHHTRLFWAVHVTHHSSSKFNLSVGFRSSVFQPIYRFFYFIPLALLGFKAADMALVYAVTQIYGILVHTSYIPKFKSPALKWIEHIFVTPSHHRVHHASNVEYLDKNMGMFLIIWDRIFGTYQEEIDDLPIKYGLVSATKDEKIPTVIFDEWKKLAQVLGQKMSFKTKLQYVFMPPGWSHDGSTKTSKQMREDLK
jgi:sterol desaturase/sphingolipid hydroxylase (fatty acid hydroxylase superfamily)